MRCLVIIPAFNEASSVPAVVESVLSYADSIVVVDDASQDNTAELAEAAGATVLRLPEQLGAWGATQTGMRYAVRKGFDIAITMDADGQHGSSDISKLTAPLLAGEANVVIGACPERGSPLRHLAWRWIRSLSGINLGDFTSGFRAYDRLAIRRAASWKATLLEYQDIGVLMLFQRHNLIITDVSVTMFDRVSGHSRIFGDWGAVLYYMTYTFVLGLSKRQNLRPHKNTGAIKKVSI
ncbi:glycosyltransferase family 2 protein [Luminiphilus sp.]|nr:glycosyltransferase family 2 protein [Luminiphilus sp.]